METAPRKYFDVEPPPPPPPPTGGWSWQSQTQSAESAYAGEPHPTITGMAPSMEAPNPLAVPLMPPQPVTTGDGGRSAVPSIAGGGWGTPAPKPQEFKGEIPLEETSRINPYQIHAAAGFGSLAPLNAPPPHPSPAVAATVQKPGAPVEIVNDPLKVATGPDSGWFSKKGEGIGGAAAGGAVGGISTVGALDLLGAIRSEGGTAGSIAQFAPAVGTGGSGGSGDPAVVNGILSALQKAAGNRSHV